MRKGTRPDRLAGFDKRLDDVSQDLPRPSIQVCNHGGRNLVTGGGRINAAYRAKAGRRAAGRIACARHDKETAPCRHRHPPSPAPRAAPRTSFARSAWRPRFPSTPKADRKSVVSGQSESVLVDLGGRRNIKNKNQHNKVNYKD